MEKSADAFRTISEVAEALETPAHVLRFWESRFPQIRPVKRAGGRRYYRPADIALLAGIRRLLHDEGMTIRGVQKILREQGVRHVAGLTEAEVPDAGFDEMAETVDLPVSAVVQPLFAFDPPARRPIPEQVAEVPGAVSPFPRFRLGQDTPAHAEAAPIADNGAVQAEIRVPETTEDAQADAPGAAPAPADAVAIGAGWASAPGHPAPDLPPSAGASAPDTAEPAGAGPAAVPDLPAERDVPPGAPSVAATPEPPVKAGPPPEPDLWRPTLLRALPRPVPAPHRAGLAAVHGRLQHLRDRLAEAARGTRS